MFSAHHLCRDYNQDKAHIHQFHCALVMQLIYDTLVD